MKKILCLLIILALAGCEKDSEPLHAGIETRVSGRVYDFSGNAMPLGLANQKIKIAEYKKKFMNYGSVGSNEDFVGFIDSTFTDVSGNYDFTFKTTGKGDVYKVVLFETIDVMSYSDAYEIEKVGKPQYFEFSGTQLYPQDLKVTGNNLMILPVKVFVRGKPYPIPDLTQNNTEVTYRVYVDKNSGQYLSFQRNKPNGKTQQFIVESPATGTTELTQQIITLNDSDFIDQD